MSNSQSRTIKRYSLAFKQKIVSEIESGQLTIGQAQKLYGIMGSSTITRWLTKLGKSHLLNTVVRIETTDEVNRLRQLERHNRQLESALAQAHLKIVALESLIDQANQHYGDDLKKKFVTPV